MAEISNYLENKLLDHVLRNTSYTSPTTVYVGLYTSDPTDAGSGTEVSGGSYARQAVSFAAASSGSSASSSVVEFPQATANWGTVAYVGLLDAVTSGNLLFHSALTTSKVVETGDVLRFNSGSITVALD